MNISTTLEGFQSTESALPAELSFSATCKIQIQKWIGWIFLFPFVGTIIFILRFVCRYRVEGMREIRKYYRDLTNENAPLVICANHLTFIDSVILIWSFGSMSDYFFALRRFPWNLPAGDFFKKKFIYRLVAYLSKCIFIHRDGSKEHKNGILGICSDLLFKNEIVTLFPEGRRSRLGLFDREHITFGVGKLLANHPNCRVLCVYVRSDKQKGYSNYPAKGSSFTLLKEVLVPKTDRAGKDAYFDLTSQIANSIQGLETQYMKRFQKSREDLLPLRKTVLVTGASEGIGRALCQEFAGMGYHLIGVARNRDRLQELTREFETKLGTKVTLFPVDLSLPGSAESLIHFLNTENLTVDILVNNAGFGVHGEFAETKVSDELNLVQLQIHSLLVLTKALLPQMKTKGEGKILNVASVYSYSPVPKQAVYAAAKSFILSFSESLAREVEGQGIQVSVLCPGVTQTEFRKRASIFEKNKSSGMTSKAVAKAACQGLLEGKRVIIPGFYNQAFVNVVRHLSGTSATRLIQAINKARGC